MKIRVGGCIIFGAFEAPDCLFFLSFLLSYCCWLHGWGWHSLALTSVFSSSIRYDTIPDSALLCMIVSSLLSRKTMKAEISIKT